MISRKLIKSNDEARAKLIAGAEQVANAVCSTLGPKGSNVAIERPHAAPGVYHDGVTVARNIALVDQFENMGAELIKEASQRTNDVAGDGTTTSMALAISILKEGNRQVTAGINPMEMKKGLDKAAQEAISQLEQMAIPLKSQDDIISVAKISSASEEIAAIVSEAIEHVGKQGKLTAEEGSLETTVEYKDGIELDGGFFSHHFVTNNRQEAEITDCRVFITSEDLDTHVDLMPLFQKIKGTISNFLFIAPKCERGALSILVTNHLAETIKAVAVKGGRNIDILNDLCAVTGATLIGRDQGLNFADIEEKHLGRVGKVIASKDKTILIAEPSPILEQRIKELESIKENNPILQERLENRIAKLKGGIAVIQVGAASDTEREEKLERVKDAIGATMAALEQGVVPGGETALLRLKIKAKGDNNHQQAGIEVFKQALMEPCKRLLDNSGANSAFVIEEIKRSKKGYDVITEKMVDMVEAGIIDPVKVTIAAIRNAVSVASMILTTDTLVSIYEKDLEN